MSGLVLLWTLWARTMNWVASVLPVMSSLEAGAVVTVTIEYDATYAGSFPLTLEAGWHDGTVTGDATPSVDGLEYVANSASQAYDGTQPIIDLINKKISWEISSFPGSTPPQTVTFQLKTKPTYTGPNIVNFPVTIGVTSPTNIPEQEALFEYVYNYKITPTATLTSIPTTTLTNSPGTGSASPTPTPIPTQLNNEPDVQVNTVQIRSIGSSNVTVFVGLNTSSPIKLNYGTSPNNLNQSLVLLEAKKTQFFTMTNLQPNQKYYFNLSSTDSNKKLFSDIYTFTTGSKQDSNSSVGVNKYSVSITQRGSVLYYGSLDLDPNMAPKLVVLNNSVLDVHLQLSQPQNVTQIDTAIRVKGVLGISTDMLESQVFNSSGHMQKVSWDLFTNKLRTPDNTGTYELLAYIHDTNGTITEYTISTLGIISPFKVIDDSSKLAIEHATVTFYRYNVLTQMFEQMPDIYGLSTNPTHTDYNGTVTVTFLPGKYKAVVTHLAYETKEVKFEILSESPQNLPVTALIRKYNLFLTTVLEFPPVLSQMLSEQDNWLLDATKSHVLRNFFVTLSVIGVLTLSIFVMATYLLSKSILVARYFELSPIKYSQEVSCNWL